MCRLIYKEVSWTIGDPIPLMFDREFCSEEGCSQASVEFEYGTNHNILVIHNPSLDDIDRIVEFTGQSKKWARAELELAKNAWSIIFDGKISHKHHLKLDEVRPYSIIFICSLCKESIRYDKFYIRRLVRGMD